MSDLNVLPEFEWQKNERNLNNQKRKKEVEMGENDEKTQLIDKPN